MSNALIDYFNVVLSISYFAIAIPEITYESKYP